MAKLKRLILDKFEVVYREYDYVSPEHLIELRQQKMQSLPEEYHKTIVFKLDVEYDEYDGTLPRLMIQWSEPETDEEYEKG